MVRHRQDQAVGSRGIEPDERAATVLVTVHLSNVCGDEPSNLTTCTVMAGVAGGPMTVNGAADSSAVWIDNAGPTDVELLTGEEYLFHASCLSGGDHTNGGVDPAYLGINVGPGAGPGYDSEHDTEHPSTSENHVLAGTGPQNVAGCCDGGSCEPGGTCPAQWCLHVSKDHRWNTDRV